MKNQVEKKPGNPGVAIGDHLYFNCKDGPSHGRVIAAGQHGVTVRCRGERACVRWADVLGHRRRASQDFDVVDRGEDGFIAADKKGRRVYLSGELHNSDEKINKSLLLKAVKNNPGLSLQETTDKKGRSVKRWKRSTPEEKSDKKSGNNTDDRQKRAATNDYGSHNVSAGDTVDFSHAGKKISGQVVSSGRDGAAVRDANTGETHRVFWHEIGGHKAKPKPPAKPDYASRSEDETDKQYAKRVVDQTDSPESLPEEHERYFNTKGSTHVPIQKLHSTKTDKENEQGGSTGPKRMLAAYHGVLGKRDPITVMPHASKEGHYEVVDGNGTYTSAKKLGWKGLPTKVVSRDEGLALKAKDVASELFSSDEIASLNRDARQPVGSNDKEKLYAMSQESHKEMTSKMDGLAKDLGFEKADGPLSSVKDWNKPGSLVFVAPIKDEKRAAEKVATDYQGDWSKLLDVVRASVAVDSIKDVKKTLDHLKKQGLELVRPPKNRFLNPTTEGYRDLMVNFKFSSGSIGELQLHAKPMLKAKNEGHKHYQVTRTLQGKYNSEEPGESWSAEDHTDFYKASKAMKELYGQAWQAVVAGDQKLTKSIGFSKMIMLARNPK